MTRVSDASSINTLINTMLRTGKRVEEANFQVVSGKVSPDYAGLAFEAQRLVNLETSRDLNSRFISNNETAELRLNVSTNSIASAQDNIRDVRELLNNFRGTGSFGQSDVENLQQFAFNSLLNMEAFLNVDVNGQYLFSGSSVNEKPVDLDMTTLAAFQEKYDGAINGYPTTRDGHLATISLSEDETAVDAANITSTNWLTFRRDSDGDATTSGVSTIEASNAAFADYEVGNRITITDTASNNGTYTIKSISSDSRTITVETEMFTDEAMPAGLGDQAAVATATFTLPDSTQLTNADTGNVTFDRAAGTIAAVTAESFASVSVGDIIKVGGTGVNGSNGSYTVTAIDATNQTLTVSAGASVTLADGSVIDAGDTGRMAFDRATDTLSADIAAFSGLSAGDVITVAGTAENNATYTVKSVASDGKSVTIESSKMTDEGTTSGNTFFDYKVGSQFSFNATTDTIQMQDVDGVAIADAFDGLQVGDSIVISNSLTNDGTYTVGAISADGSTITMDSTTALVGSTEVDTNDTSIASSARGLDFRAGNKILFDATTDTISLSGVVATQIDTVTLAGTFEVGDIYSVTIGSTTVSHTVVGGDTDIDGVRTALRTKINLDATLSALLTASDGGAGELVLTADTAGTGFVPTYAVTNVTAGTDDSTMTRVQTSANASTTATAGTFSGLRAGQQFTISGSVSNDGTYTVASIASDGSSITVSEDITTTETFNPVAAGTAVDIAVYGAAGSVATTQSYYNGDNFSLTHRVDENRTIDIDVTAAHPAFEKAIRALSILVQGKFGTEGGLDQNQGRINDVLYLLNDALSSPSDGTPPYGTELESDMDEVIFNLGFKQVTLRDTIAAQKSFNNLLDGFVSDTENVDQLEAITRLMDEQRSLEASYQAMSRVFSMNLADFL